MTAQSPDLRNLLERLRAYRPANEWGNGVHHVICTEAADALESLQKERDEARELLAKIYFWINDHVEVPTKHATRRMMDINELIGIDALEAVRISARATLKEQSDVE